MLVLTLCGLLVGCNPNDAPLAAHVGAQAKKVAKANPAKSPHVEPNLPDSNSPEKNEPEPTVVAQPPVAEQELALVDDAATQLLRERLSPPKQVLVAPPTGVVEPQPRQVGAVELLTRELLKLPDAEVPKTPAILPHERFRAPFLHPAHDAPPLAFARDPARPEMPRLPIGPGAHVASPDVKRVPHVERFARDAEPAVQPGDDPTAAATARVVTAAVPLPVPVPAPLQFLTIPDPFENIRAVELRLPPADADPPAVSHVRPPRPVLTPPAPQP